MYTFFLNLPADDPKAVLDQIYAKVNEHDMPISGFVYEKTRDCQELAATPWARHGAAALFIDRLLCHGTPPPDVQAVLYRPGRDPRRVNDQGTITDTTGKDVLSVGWNPPASYNPNGKVKSSIGGTP